MNRWWRAYDESLYDPKLKGLSDHLFRRWFNVLCVASIYEGKLPVFPVLVRCLSGRKDRIEADIKELIVAGLLDEIDGSIVPHNWLKRQYKSDVSTGRVRDHRKRFKSVSGNVSETEMKRPQSTDTDTEKKERKKDAAPSAAILQISDPEKDLFDRGKLLLGKSSGGLIRNLLTAKNNSVPLARAAIEMASTKQDPKEYLGAIIRGRDADNYEAARIRGDRW